MSKSRLRMLKLTKSRKKWKKQRNKDRTLNNNLISLKKTSKRLRMICKSSMTGKMKLERSISRLN